LMSCGSCEVLTNEKYTEKLDWTLDSAGISKIDAQTSNGSISFDGKDTSQVIVSAFKEVRAHNFASPELCSDTS
jgi:hypothetical protein